MFRSTKGNILCTIISCLLCFSTSKDLTNKTYFAEAIKGENFLKSVMHQIQSEQLDNAFQSLLANRFTRKGETATPKHGLSDDQSFPDAVYLPTPLPQDFLSQDNEKHEPSDADIPPLSRDELIALYRAAIAKGTGLDLKNLPMLQLAEDEKISAQEYFNGNTQNLDDVVIPSDHGTVPGYYYYFYPISNLTGGEEFGIHNTTNMMPIKLPPMSVMTAMMKEPGLLMKAPNNGQKQVEPLFIAMASFVGMAMMFILSILFMPKFGNIRSREVPALKTAPDEMLTLSSVIGEVIEGKDCSKRIACEVGLRLGKKPVRILEILLPANLARQITQIRKSVERKENCHLLTCQLPDRKNKNKNRNNLKVQRKNLKVNKNNQFKY